MSVTKIHNDTVALRAENRKLMEVNAQLRTTAAQALGLVNKQQKLIKIITSTLQGLRDETS